MTTIATVITDKYIEMASDSSCSENDTHVGGIKKIHKVGKCLIGFCGEISSGQKFVEWYKEGADDQELYPWGGDFDALVVTPDGTIKMYEKTSMEPIAISKKEKYAAIGSGIDVALGCMFQGGSAADAIRSAIKHNMGSKGPVRAQRIKR
jgi:20S proteasome alpha/beta subunit